MKAHAWKMWQAGLWTSTAVTSTPLAAGGTFWLTCVSPYCGAGEAVAAPLLRA